MKTQLDDSFEFTFFRPIANMQNKVIKEAEQKDMTML